MMRRNFSTPQDRWRSAAIVAGVHVALGYALISGLGVEAMRALPEAAVTMLSIPDEPPPPEPPATPMQPERAPQPTERPKDPEGAAAPPALRNTPTPVVVPPPQVKLPVPTPIAASPIAGAGSAANPGAAEVPGPGTGRGGMGDGLGSGRFGDGTGGGGGGGVAQPPRYVSGEIQERDAPSGLDIRRTMQVTFRVFVDRSGRARDCRIERSSGMAVLDAATCRAALRRLRWAPARDTAGRAVDGWSGGRFAWHPRPGADRWVEAEEIVD